MSEWRPWHEFEAMPPDQRPGRIFVLVEGWKAHSGVMWDRRYADLAWTHPKQPFLLRQEDRDRIVRDGGMDGIEAVLMWHPASIMLGAPATTD